MVNGTVDGDASTVINNYAKIEEATAGCLTFLANPKYTHYVYTTEASAILVRKDFEPEHEVKATLIRVDDPYKTLADLLNFVNSQRPEKRGIEQPIHVGQGTQLPDDVYVGAFAYIGDGVTIGKNVKIYPQVYVGDGVTLGDDVILYPGVKIYHGCRIGNRCIVQGGAVIGGDGFGFAPKEDGTYEKISQVGIVIRVSSFSRTMSRLVPTRPSTVPLWALPWSSRAPSWTTSSRLPITLRWENAPSWQPKWVSPVRPRSVNTTWWAAR